MIFVLPNADCPAKNRCSSFRDTQISKLLPVISHQYFIQITVSVRPSVTDVGGSSGNKVLPCRASRYNVGQSANFEWWVASWLQPWSLSQQCDATKGCTEFPIARYPSTLGSQVVLCTLIPINPCRPPQSLHNSKTMNAYTIDKTLTNA